MLNCQFFSFFEIATVWGKSNKFRIFCFQLIQNHIITLFYSHNATQLPLKGFKKNWVFQICQQWTIPNQILPCKIPIPNSFTPVKCLISVRLVWNFRIRMVLGHILLCENVLILLIILLEKLTETFVRLAIEFDNIMI